MGRKITMTGKNAKYIEHRAANATPDDDRDIRLEGEDAEYQEYAYGQASQPKQEEKPSEDAVKEYQKDAARKLLMDHAEYVEPMNEADVLEKLKPIFYNNEADVRLFLKEIAGMPSGDITDLVNRWVKEKRISDYGNSRKGALWEILNDAGLYSKSRQNWNRRVY